MKCEETATRTRDLPVTGGKTIACTRPALLFKSSLLQYIFMSMRTFWDLCPLKQFTATGSIIQFSHQTQFKTDGLYLDKLGLHSPSISVFCFYRFISRFEDLTYSFRLQNKNTILFSFKKKRILHYRICYSVESALLFWLLLIY